MYKSQFLPHRKHKYSLRAQYTVPYVKAGSTYTGLWRVQGKSQLAEEQVGHSVVCGNIFFLFLANISKNKHGLDLNAKVILI
jgi:hypothetical protein